MIASSTQDEIRLESERRLAISTVAIILGLDLAVMILDLRAAGPGLTSLPPGDRDSPVGSRSSQR